MSEMTQHKLGRASFVDIERSTWSITYPTFRPPFVYTIAYTENGLWLHLAKADIDQAHQSLDRMLKAFGTSVGALGGAAGTIVVPGGGTLAGIAAGSAVGRAIAELADILLELAKYLATDEQGAFDIHMSPHGFQCGNNFAGDPNIFLGPLWRPIFATLGKLQPQKAPGSFGARGAGPSMNAAKVDTSKPMSGSRKAETSPAKPDQAHSVETEGGDEAKPRAGAKKGKTPAKEPAAAFVSAATKPGAAKLVSLAEPVTGKLALGQTHYWKFKPKGTKLKFKVYSRLLADTYAVDGSLAVADEEGGVIDRTSFSVAEHGEDFSMETIDVALDEPMEMAVLSINSKSSISERADFEYKIKAL
jgi:hypothetical protein